MRVNKNYIVITSALLALFVVFGCGTANQTSSPSDTLKKYVDAYDRKDLTAIKQTFSKGTMKMYEDAAQKRKTSADEIIKGQFEAGLFDDLESQVEPVSEKIEGDSSVVEVKSKGKENEMIPLVKEDGEWKIAFDQYMQTVMKRMTEEMNKPPTNSADK